MISNRATAAACLTTCLFLWGCGPTEPVLERIPVFGQVTSEGDKEFNGAIRFLPQEGNTGPVAATSVTKGEYRFDSTNGPVAGKYHVVIVPAAESKGSRRLPSAGGPTPATAAADSSTPSHAAQPLSATVSKDDSSFDFNLQ